MAIFNSYANLPEGNLFHVWKSAATHSRASQETTSLAAGSLELQTPHPLDLRKMIPSEKKNGPTYHNWMSYDEFQQFQPLKCYVQSIHINSKDVRITLCCFGVQDLDIGFVRNLPPTASPQSEASHAGDGMELAMVRSELMSVQMGSIIGYDMWIWSWPWLKMCSWIWYVDMIWTYMNHSCIWIWIEICVPSKLIMLDPLLSIQSHSSKHLPSSSNGSISLLEGPKGWTWRHLRTGMDMESTYYIYIYIQ